MGPKTKKPCSMAGLEDRNKKPGSVAGFRERLAAFTAVHAAMKTDLFRAEKRFVRRSERINETDGVKVNCDAVAATVP